MSSCLECWRRQGNIECQVWGTVPVLWLHRCVALHMWPEHCSSLKVVPSCLQDQQITDLTDCRYKPSMCNFNEHSFCDYRIGWLLTSISFLWAQLWNRSNVLNTCVRVIPWCQPRPTLSQGLGAASAGYREWEEQTSSDVRCAEQFSSLCFVSVHLKENEKEGETGFSIKHKRLGS